jgi:hypothetical protein
LIPIYAQGKSQDPRDTVPDIPERPAGQRTEAGPPPNNGTAESPLNALFGRFGFGGFQFATATGGNVAFHFGSPILFFPLALQMAVNSGFFNQAFGGGGGMATGATQQQMQDSPGARLRAFASRMMFMLGVLTLLVIVLF